MNESQKRKQTPVYSGVMMYFPDALDAVARQSWAGNEKHNPGEPLHWAREKSSDHMDCAARHMMTPDAIDPETGETHLTAAAWRILAALQIQQEKRARAHDIENELGEVIGKSVPLAEAFDLTKDIETAEEIQERLRSLQARGHETLQEMQDRIALGAYMCKPIGTIVSID